MLLILFYSLYSWYSCASTDPEDSFGGDELTFKRDAAQRRAKGGVWGGGCAPSPRFFLQRLYEMVRFGAYFELKSFKLLHIKIA